MVLQQTQSLVALNPDVDSNIATKKQLYLEREFFLASNWRHTRGTRTRVVLLIPSQ